MAVKSLTRVAFRTGRKGAVQGSQLREANSQRVRVAICSVPVAQTRKSGPGTLSKALAWTGAVFATLHSASF